MHSDLIIHRDLKPENIFLAERHGIVKLGDLGASRRIDGQKTVYNQSMRSTPAYNAIETAQGQEYSTKSDIYALGLILYDLCKVKKPMFADVIENKVKLISNTEYAPGMKYSKELAQIALSCVARETDDRPSCADLLNIPIIINAVNELQKIVEGTYDQTVFEPLEFVQNPDLGKEYHT